jgi:hypothetical protein
MERWSDERIIDSDDMFEDVEGLPVEPADASIDAPETT